MQILVVLTFSAVATKPRILTPTFAVLCLATICFFLSNNILVPVLPRYLESSGLLPYQLGIVIGATSVSAIAARLAIGREIDRRGRRIFLSLGVAVGALASLAYPFFHGIAPLLVLRLFHGISIASFYPAAAALIVDITPRARRGEALSYFSMLLYAAYAVGPAIGEFLVTEAGFTAAFLGAAAVAGAGLAVSAAIKEPPRETTQLADLPLIHRAAAFPALVLGLAALAYAALGTFVPLYVSHEGSGDSRYFFLALSIATLAVRSFVGRLVDRYRPSALVVPSILLCAASLFTIATSARQAVLITGAVLFGMGWGGLFPGLLNFTIDRVRPEERGSAMGTFTAAFDAVFGAGQPLLGLVLQVSSFSWVFIAGGLGATASALAFVAGRRRSDALFPVVEEP
jgi:MFS family permease